MRKFVSIFILLVVLVACGGGGNGTVNVQPPASMPQQPQQPLPFPFRGGANQHYDTSQLPNKSRADAKHMPIYHDGTYDVVGGFPVSPESRSKRLFVGVDQGTTHIRNLPVTGERGKTEIRFGTLNDGVGREQVVKYINEATGGSISKYETAPEVRVIGPSNERDRNMVLAAVRLVNAALPESTKISVGAPLPGFSLRNTVDNRGAYFTSGQELDNTIHIEFVPDGAFYDGNAGATSWANYPRGGAAIENSYIQFNKGANVYRDSTIRRSVILLAHEIIHSLGFDGHPSPNFDTILESTSGIYALIQGTKQPRSLLYPIDREALRVMYSRLGNGLRPESLGLWTSSSMHIHGNGPHTGFGVALRNGYAEPYAYGYLPGIDLAQNRALFGSVSWIGALLGLTPTAASVAGDAEIGVNLRTLTGRADITNLETWAVGAAPGEAGTGIVWGDGDLGYSIVVRGNTFRETGGDAGRLTGVFVGASHEGAAGTLERSDLTAAFGASR